MAKTLKDINIGDTVTVIRVGGQGALRQHFLDMGMIPGVRVTLVKYAPMGDPMEFKIHDYMLTLRITEAEQIEVSDEVHRKGEEVPVQEPAVDHPGYGETGVRFHNAKTDESKALPKGQVLTFALAGNQNSGKTTLFNQLTGANQHVGNFPGVTVDKRTGIIRGEPNTEVTDLPGIYSLSPYTEEEVVSRQYILEEKPQGIIDIVDATNLERNLYLTLQLMELHVPMVLALNMMDEMRGNGGSVDVNRMEEMLGIPVVPISAAQDEGVDELIRHAIHVARYQECDAVTDFCGPNDHNGAVHRAIHGIMTLISDHAERADIPLRFAATKVVEQDQKVIDALRLDENEKNMIEHILVQMEKERGLDRRAAIADMRFHFIEEVTDACVIKPTESKEQRRSERADRILTGKYTAIPIFILVMAAVFALTFNVLGLPLQGLLQQGIDAVRESVAAWMIAAHVAKGLRLFVTQCLFDGVGTVVSFVPIIVILFLFLSILEDSGYMARIAFVMDKPLRKLGLSGRSIVPLLVGFGCSVPAIMSTRTLPSERDRKMTIMLIPFMSCTAKLPIYALFAGVFFPKYAALVMICLYVLGIAVGILTAAVLKHTAFKGEPVPFVMELPNYRMPGIKNVGRLMWDKTTDFIERAFSIVLIANIVIWFLRSFDPALHMVAANNMDSSILAQVAGVIAPVFAPMGFGNWKMVTALISGFLAKESVVAVLGTLYSGSALASVLSPVAAAAFLAFCLLYTPCVAAMSSVRRELGTRWMLGIIAMQCGVAWLISFAVHAIGMLL
jgi:ferrous iron transport protein B